MTQKYRRLLRKWREALKEQWAAGLFMSSDREEMVTANFQALATVSILEKLARLDYEEFIETLTEEE